MIVMVHFLLDDDPFANLTVPTTPVPTTPVPEPSPPRPPPPRRVLVPASRKPAFAPKPSLPSLDTLSRVNLVLPKKVRFFSMHHPLLTTVSFSFARAVSVLAFLSSPGTISPAHSQTRIPHHTTRTLFLIMSISANLNSL